MSCQKLPSVDYQLLINRQKSVTNTKMLRSLMSVRSIIDLGIFYRTEPLPLKWSAPQVRLGYKIATSFVGDDERVLRRAFGELSAHIGKKRCGDKQGANCEGERVHTKSKHEYCK